VAQRAGAALLTGTVVAVLFAAVATSGQVQFADRAPPSIWERSPDPPTATTPPTTVESDAIRPPGDFRLQLPHFVDVALRLLFFGCLAAAVVLLLVYAWHHRPRLAWQHSRRHRSVRFDILDDVAALVSADADAQRAALRQGSPRNAIVECWLRLESAVVAAGVIHDPAETSTEFTVRVLTTLQVDQVAIERLAALYREARFSDHPMDEHARSAAIDALDDIHEALRAARGREVATT